MVKFTDTEYDIISELLRVASVSIHETMTALDSRNPGATYIEVLEHYATQAANIRDRIEAR